VDVTNRGVRSGSTVVQVYASVPDSTFERPPRRLVGFRKIHAEAGETVKADVTIDRRQLDVRIDGTWVTEDLDIVLHIGQCAGDDAVSLILSG
jgi:beta-glucosidase